MTCDFLVIGAGIAGLTFAIRAAKHGSVIVLTKGSALDSNTAWAQGGLALVLPEGLRDEGDTLELHIADTLDAGAGLCKEDVVRAIVSEGALDLAELRKHLVRLLPPYARPLFLRIVDRIEATATFKHTKNDLKRHGYDPAATGDPPARRE